MGGRRWRVGRVGGPRCRSAAAAAAVVAAAVVVAAVGVAAAVAAAAAALPPVTTGPAGENRCLSRLTTHPAEFASCRTGTICFMFIEEDPFIVIGEGVANGTGGGALNPRTPFRCSDYAARGLSGFAFKLYEQLWPTSPDLCVYAGDIDECTFTGLTEYLHHSRAADHPAHGHALGVTGALIFSPPRRRLGISTDSILEDRLMMVRRRQTRAAFWQTSPFDASALSWPFTQSAWLLVARALVCVLVVTGVLSAWRPTPVWALMGAGRTMRRLQTVVLQWIFNWYG